MNTKQADQILEFLGRYNKHFSGLVGFLLEKQQKVLADDLLWLHDSLSEEQRLAMAGASLENKRLALLKEAGYENYTSSMLLEVCPEEYKGRFKCEFVDMENSIDRIKKLNSDILETIEKKLAIAESYLREQGAEEPGFYDGAGSKVRLGDPEEDIIGSV